MRILMLYPEFPDTFWSFKHALRFIKKKASFPPLGLLTIASMLPAAWDIRLVDLNVTSLLDKDLVWADLVFVSAMVIQRESTHKVLTRCHNAGCTLVAGGPLFLGEHESFPEVDHFVLGEGEVTLPRFLEDLANGTPQRVYACDHFPDMTESPTPMWSLVDRKQYASMCIQYSRGCPFDCEFCNITSMFGHKPRTKTSAQIIRDLDALYETGWRGGVFFVDDNFIGNRIKLKRDVLPALITWRGNKAMSFQTEVSINLADDPELMSLMRKAGFNRVFVGIETPDEASLAECNKIQNKGRDLVAAVKTLQRAGFEVQGGFIVGFDNDTPSIFKRQIEFIQKSGIVTAMVGLLQAPYGTRLYKRIKAEGRLRGEQSGDNTDDSMNFEPKMDAKVLHEGYHEIMRTIYSPKVYYERVRTFLREYDPLSLPTVLDRQHYLALFRSIYSIGLRGKAKLEYWRLFFWTLLRRPRMFPLAITFAIYGAHFEYICDTYLTSGH